MSYACVVGGCPSSSRSKKIKFFETPPMPPQRRKQWMLLIDRMELFAGSPTTYICEKHFLPSDFVTIKKERVLKNGAMPSLLLPTKRPSSSTETVKPQETNSGMQSCPLKNNDDSACKGRKSKSRREEDYKFAFEALCDKFLTHDVAAVVKQHAYFGFNVKKRNTMVTNYTLFCMHLYHTSPASYLALQKNLGLPPLKTLKIKSFVPSVKEQTKFVQIMKCRVNSMSDIEKKCVVLVSVVELKPHLYYNIRQDNLVGGCESESGRRVARRGAVLAVRGLLRPWLLPVDCELFPDDDQLAISIWVHKVITALMRSGLDIRVCMSNISSKAIAAFQNPGPTVEKPYFTIEHTRIYYVYDPDFLIKSAYSYLLDHEFHFNNSVAKRQDIFQFYSSDSIKEHRLVPELTSKHVLPEDDDVTARTAVETLSDRVACGIANYVYFGQMDKTAMGTVKFLTMMDRIYKLMTSRNTKNRSKYQEPFTGSESQMDFVVEALTFLRNLRIIKDGVDLTDEVKFMEQLQISIRAAMLLFQEQELINVPNMCFNNMRLDVLDEFFRKIINKSKTKDITARRLIPAFRNMFFDNVLKKSAKKSSPQAISDIFEQHKNEEPVVKTFSAKQFERMSNIHLRVKMYHYQGFKLPASNQLIAVCEFVLRKTYEIHHCITPKKMAIDVEYKRVKGFLGDHFEKSFEDSRFVPDDALLQFMERLEAPLEARLAARLAAPLGGLLGCLTVDKFPQATLMALNELKFHCPCFPRTTMVNLYFRLRLTIQLKLNNKRFKNDSSGDLSFIYEHYK